MATNEMLWRKLPIGIIRDEDMDYIADQLSPQLKAAPYMFYFTALCKADNDGIFDLEDGVIFSRLMRIGTPEDVFKIANLMIQRKIILRAGETTRCMLTTWEYPLREKPRSLDDRRAIVAKQIEDEKRVLTAASFSIQKQKPIDVNFENNPAANIFFCDLNDKNGENVTKNFFDDKSKDFVDEKKETERIERIERVERIDTQERKDEKEKERPQAFQLPHDFQACEKDSQEIKETLEELEKSRESQSVAESALSVENTENTGDPKIQEEQIAQVMKIASDFFAKNNLGFNTSAESEILKAIANRMIWLSDSRNPPEIVTSVFLGQFKKLVEDDGYYKGAPLTPEQLLKPGTYSHVLSAASKILLNKSNSERWEKQQAQLRAEIERERETVCDGLDNEYLKYKIDPQDPNRSQKLLIAKANEQKESQPP